MQRSVNDHGQGRITSPHSSPPSPLYPCRSCPRVFDASTIPMRLPWLPRPFLPIAAAIFRTEMAEKQGACAGGTLGSVRPVGGRSTSLGTHQPKSVRCLARRLQHHPANLPALGKAVRPEHGYSRGVEPYPIDGCVSLASTRRCGGRYTAHGPSAKEPMGTASDHSTSTVTCGLCKAPSTANPTFSFWTFLS